MSENGRGLVELARFLEEGRERKQLSYYALAKKAGADARTVRSVLKAQRKPQGATLERICAVLELNPDAALELPIMPPPVYVEKETPKIEGVSYREQWRAEVTDMALLAKAAGANLALVNLLLPNMPALNQMARAMKSAMSIPGVMAVSEKIVSAKA